jgi:hypothetical protein
MEFLFLNSNSIGFSRVIICHFLFSLKYSISAQSVVDLPEPVLPDTRNNPLSTLNSFWKKTGSIQRASSLIIFEGSRLITKRIFPLE